jgi:DNA polymerase III subunit chi
MEKWHAENGAQDTGRLNGAIIMTEIVFYQLRRQPLERVLPTLIEKSLARGWRVVVQAASEERVEALDAQLWTFRDDSFLPHGTWREAEAHEQPILLTLDGDNPNGAAVRFLVDGAPMPADVDAYQRVVLLVDGEDADAAAAAREHWGRGKARGFDVVYWQPDEEGRWQRVE